MQASAPGKLIVSGEYAVVEGAPALVLAMNRRVVARTTADPTTRPTVFIRAVADQLATRGLALPALAIDSSALYDNAEKLGLGSSAAVTVAAAAIGLARRTGNPTSALEPTASPEFMLDLDDIFDLALAAHRAAQSTLGAAGSGADVAAATYGGALEYATGQPVRRLALPPITLIPFALGTSAATAPLVAQVLAARPDFTALAAASRRVCDATDDTSLIAALADNAAAFAALAAATGAPLIPPAIHQIAERVRVVGAIAKTTGAGGGDVGLVVAPANADRNLLHAAIIQAGCRILDLTVDGRGVDIDRDAA